MKPDRIQKKKGALLQHGPYNDRVYVMKVEKNLGPEAVETACALAQENGYSKIFAKVPPGAKNAFLTRGFTVEATIPGFFRNEAPVYFMSLYLDEARRDLSAHPEQIQSLLDSPARAPRRPRRLPAEYTCRVLQEADTAAMAALFTRVFATYPFPIFDPAYLARTMQEQMVYTGIFHTQELVATASAEIDTEACTAEVTDFATLPAFRRKNLASYLLGTLEKILSRRGIITSFTIARAPSRGINRVFIKAGYSFAGTLIKNTNIAGRFEDMNVWYRRLEKPDNMPGPADQGSESG